MSEIILNKKAGDPSTPSADKVTFYYKGTALYYMLDDGVPHQIDTGGASGVTDVTGTAPIVSSGGATPAISLADTAVAAGAYTYAGFTVDAKGRLTAAASGTAPVTNVTGTAPITSSGGATPAISLNDTAVVAGSYTFASITVDSKGRLTAASSGTATAALPPMHINGLIQSNAAGDPTNDITISQGKCRDASDTVDMIQSGTLTKQLDALWGVGNNAGGLDTGSIANTKYYIWLIKRSDTGVVDALFSTSFTAPTMPTNYDYKRLIGWIERVAGAIGLFHAYEYMGGALALNWDVPTLEVNIANTLTTTRRTDVMRVPLHFSVLAHLIVSLYDTSGGNNQLVNIDQTDAAPSGSAAPLGYQSGSALRAGYYTWIHTSTAGAVASRSDIATVNEYYIATLGFIWPRRN